MFNFLEAVKYAYNKNRGDNPLLIEAYTNAPPPKLPYLTAYILSMKCEDRWAGKATRESEFLVKEKILKNDVVTIQFDSYSTNKIEALNNIIELKDMFMAKLRGRKLEKFGIFGILNEDYEIKELFEKKEDNNFLFRYSLDIDFQFVTSLELERELARTIELETEKEEIVIEL